MSFTVNNAAENGGTNQGSTTLTQTVTISISAGHTIGAAVFYNDFTGGGYTISGIADTGGNVYQLPAAGQLGGAVTGNHFIAMGYSLAVANAITSVTASVAGGTGNQGFLELIVWDITATGTIVFSSANALYTATTTTTTDGLSSGSMSVTSTDALLLGAGRDFNSAVLSAGTGFTLDVASPPSAFYPEHKAVTTSAAATFTDPSAGNSAIVGGLAFQIAAAAAPILLGQACLMRRSRWE